LALPLIRNNPSCLDIRNSAGITARHLLQNFKDCTELLHGQEQACPNSGCVTHCMIYFTVRHTHPFNNTFVQDYPGELVPER